MFSVAHKPDDPENAVITAVHAIFPVDGGKEAPASVVGFQFTQKSLYNRFIEITKMKAAEVIHTNDFRLLSIFREKEYTLYTTIYYRFHTTMTPDSVTSSTITVT